MVQNGPLFFFFKTKISSIFQFAFYIWNSLTRKLQLDGCKGPLEIAAFDTIKSATLLVMTFAAVMLLFQARKSKLLKRSLL